MARFGDGIGVVKIQCPYCGESFPVVKQILSEYKDFQDENIIDITLKDWNFQRYFED